ncbi:MAG: hypothetical protein KKF58_05000 [Gammaproteobacteria bacterium]|nr:hypothetical protein [Gammaproteobacteria bacterium]
MADELSELVTEVLRNRQNLNSLIHVIPLTFASIFNARHGLELSLKSLMVIQGDGSSLKSKYQIHDLAKLFEFLEKGEDGLVQIHSIPSQLDEMNYKEDLATLKRMVAKYQGYSFRNIPSFINFEEISKVDLKNMFFRFPDESSISESVRYLFDERCNCHGDIDIYMKRNFEHLQNLIELSKEIRSDVRDLIRIKDTVGTTVAAYVSKKVGS